MSTEQKLLEQFILLLSKKYDLSDAREDIAKAFLAVISQLQQEEKKVEEKKEKKEKKVSGYDLFINCEMGKAGKVWKSLGKEEKNLWKVLAHMQNNKN
jgi:hypothetical protein